MTKLEWCRANAPDALKQASDEELLNHMTEAWLDYSRTELHNVDPNMSHKTKWEIALKLSKERCTPEVLRLIDKGIDVSLYNNSGVLSYSNVVFCKYVELISAGYDRATAEHIAISTGDNPYGHDIYLKLIKAGFDYSKIDLTKADVHSLKLVIRFIERSIWNDQLIPYVEANWQEGTLEALSTLVRYCKDISWVSLDVFQSSYVLLAKIAENFGYLPECLQRPDIDTDDIYFFRDFGRTEAGRSVMSVVRCRLPRELLLKHPDYLNEIIDFDKKLTPLLCNYISNSASNWAGSSIEDKCKYAFAKLNELYSKYSCNSPEELEDCLRELGILGGVY